MVSFTQTSGFLRTPLRMIGLLIGGLALAVFVLLAPTIGSSLSAQQGNGNGNANGNANGQVNPICMTRGDGDASVNIIVPNKSDARNMWSKGFKRTPCQRAFGSVEAQRQWRDEICTLASVSAPAMLEALEGQLGEKPAALCGMAEQATERWQRKRSRQQAQGVG